MKRLFPPLPSSMPESSTNPYQPQSWTDWLKPVPEGQASPAVPAGITNFVYRSWLGLCGGVAIGSILGFSSGWKQAIVAKQEPYRPALRMAVHRSFTYGIKIGMFVSILEVGRSLCEVGRAKDDVYNMIGGSILAGSVYGLPGGGRGVLIGAGAAGLCATAAAVPLRQVEEWLKEEEMRKLEARREAARAATLAESAEMQLAIGQTQDSLQQVLVLGRQLQEEQQVAQQSVKKE